MSNEISLYYSLLIIHCSLKKPIQSLNMKKLILLISGLFFFGHLMAQQQAAVFNHYHITPILINPAHAGFTGQHALQMNIASQWAGFSDAPRSYHLAYNGPIGKTLGVGLGLMSETIGNMTHLRFQMNYAFRYQISDNFNLSAGFSADFHTLRLAESVFDNPQYQEGDPIAEQAVDGNRIFDATLGFYGEIYGNTQIGLAFHNLVVTRIGEIEDGDSEGAFLQYPILFFGHEFEVEPYNFKVQPSIMFERLYDKDIQVDFNLKGSFINDKLIAGVTYRTGLGDFIGILLGTKIDFNPSENPRQQSDAFQIYYSYDLGFQKFQEYNNGTHEVSVLFNFGNGKKRYDRSTN